MPAAFSEKVTFGSYLALDQALAPSTRSALTVLAADKDFTLIAAITGQPIETLTD
jgi:hypothetical protein